MTPEFLSLLKQYVSLKSISTDPAFKDDILKTVDWLKNIFSTNGFSVETFEAPLCNPVVFASYTIPEATETVLVYGHYDVQPAAKEEGWRTEPFELTELDGRLYARGVVDNKGQNLIHTFTVIDLIKQNELKYNVKFLIEGNEETSNVELASIIEKNKDKLACDYILVSDGEILGNNPVIEYSLRGGLNCTIKYTTAKNNLHSGIYGGGVPSAAQELSGLISKFYDNQNRVAVPGFYDNVDEIPANERENNKKLLKNEQEVFDITGVSKLLLEPGMDFYSAVGLRPTLQVTGIKTGYIGDGYANIVPATAEARVNFRFVRSQDPEKVFKAFEQFVRDNTPNYVKMEISRTVAWEAVKVDITSPKVLEVRELLGKAYGVEVFTKPVGGSIPVVTDFKNVLGRDTLLVSLGNEDCNMHGTDENFRVDLVEKGLKFSKLFFGR